jgi:hypothetical protein
MRVLCVYGAIAYLLRSIQLAATNPKPVFNDPIPIFNLYQYGYLRGIDRILIFEAIALVTIYLAVRIVSTRHTQLHVRSNDFRQLRAVFLATYALGWIGRLYYLHVTRVGSSTNGNPLTKLNLLCGAAIALLLLYSDWWRPHSTAQHWLIGITLIELIWCFMASTKEPILGVALGIYLLRPEATVDKKWRERPFFTRLAVVVLSVVVIVSFSLINALRDPELTAASNQSNPTTTSIITAELSSPGRFISETAARIAVRLDGLQSASYVMLEPSKGYLSGRESIDVLISDALPGSITGINKLTPGQYWASRIEHSTVLISLAETVPAEGYAMGGFFGMILWCLLFGTTLGLATRAFKRVGSRPTYMGLVMATFLLSPSIVETGLFQAWITLISAFEANLILVLLLLASAPQREGQIWRTKSARQ